jgi:DNA-binding HxlR family transcriptional regulator
MCDDDPVAAALDPAVLRLVRRAATPPERAVLAALREGRLTEPALERAVTAPEPVVRRTVAELRDRGLVRRADAETRGSPAYALTRAGAELWPVLEAIDELRDRCGRDGQGRS